MKDLLTDTAVLYESLPERLHKVAFRKWVLGESVADIGKIEGIPRRVVESLIRECKRYIGSVLCRD